MSLKNVSKDVLRNYYELSYGMPGLFRISPEAYNTNNFEEYYALTKITSPNISKWRVAKNAKNPSFNELMDSFEPDSSKEDDSGLDWFAVRRKKALELSKAKIPAETGRLLLDRCGGINELEELLKLDKLYYLSLVLCKNCSSDEVVKSGSKQISSIRISECDTGCMERVLALFSAEKIEITDYDSKFFNCETLSRNKNLSDLRIIAPYIYNIGSLQSTHLINLFLKNMVFDDEFRDFLSNPDNSLTNLDISSLQPFGPGETKFFPKSLTRLCIPGYEEYRKDWIDWAVENPSIQCVFWNLESATIAPKSGKMEVHEIYKDVAIIKYQKGKKAFFEIFLDFVGQFELDQFSSNNELEDMVMPNIKKEKRKINFSSERDMFVANSISAEDLKWLIDSILEFR